MSELIYWPYDEVKLQLINDNTRVKLSTPWLKAEISAKAFESNNLFRLTEKMAHETLSGQDLPLVNGVFRVFNQYPVSYILPNNKTGPALDKAIIKDESIINNNLPEAISSIFASAFNHDELNLLSTSLGRHAWEWDAEQALVFSSFQDKVHPESIFSVARRFHIIELINRDNGQEVFTKIASLHGEQLKQALASLVRQNHYVTKECQNALKPALEIAGEAKTLVADFMRQERGHDQLLGKAIFHLGFDPEELEVSITTKALMHLLKFMATNNFLSFAMAVDAFERSNGEDMDPMARLLQNAGFSKSATYINAHMKINDEGEHDNIAIKFLENLALCDKAYALESMRLMEILSLLMSKVSESSISQLSLSH